MEPLTIKHSHMTMTIDLDFELGVIDDAFTEALTGDCLPPQLFALTSIFAHEPYEKSYDKLIEKCALWLRKGITYQEAIHEAFNEFIRDSNDSGDHGDVYDDVVSMILSHTTFEDCEYIASFLRRESSDESATI